eukprot:2990957-Rhodomonas_salina.4
MNGEGVGTLDLRITDNVRKMRSSVRAKGHRAKDVAFKAYGGYANFNVFSDLTFSFGLGLGFGFGFGFGCVRWNEEEQDGADRDDDGVRNDGGCVRTMMLLVGGYGDDDVGLLAIG